MRFFFAAACILSILIHFCLFKQAMLRHLGRDPLVYISTMYAVFFMVSYSTSCFYLKSTWIWKVIICFAVTYVSSVLGFLFYLVYYYSINHSHVMNVSLDDILIVAIFAPYLAIKGWWLSLLTFFWLRVLSYFKDRK